MKIFPDKFFVFALLLSTSSLSLFAQSGQTDFSKPNKRGNFYIFWGWNISEYSKSDIHFYGEQYDFTLDEVVAHDKPTAWDAGIYLNPSLMTVPQTNFKIGYFLNDHWSLSLGVDHMKYVMVQDQTVTMNGYINDASSPYNGVYDNTDMVMTLDFLLFEHTDGLNYINAEINRFDDLLILFGQGMKNLEINLLEGAGIGVLLPKTNAKLLNNARHDDFHLSGYGINLKVGLNITFYKIFFIQSEFKGGFIHMPEIRTTYNTADRASQAFTYFEADFLFGARFRLFKEKR